MIIHLLDGYAICVKNAGLGALESPLRVAIWNDDGSWSMWKTCRTSSSTKSWTLPPARRKRGKTLIWISRRLERGQITAKIKLADHDVGRGSCLRGRHAEGNAGSRRQMPAFVPVSHTAQAMGQSVASSRVTSSRVMVPIGWHHRW